MEELKYEVKVMCKNRYVVPEVMQKMAKVGFIKMKETWNDPASDIRSVYVRKDQEDIVSVLDKLARDNEGYISQVSSKPYRSLLGPRKSAFLKKVLPVSIMTGYMTALGSDLVMGNPIELEDVETHIRSLSHAAGFSIGIELYNKIKCREKEVKNLPKW